MPPVEAGFSLSPQEPPHRRVADVLLAVGRDTLGIDVCRRLKDADSSIGVIAAADSASDELEALGVRIERGDARQGPVLARAGVRTAKTIVALTGDDQTDLRVALAARDLNPDIRVVIRQFNRQLGQKIASRLLNCEAVSPETHSAATYAASCLNPSVYHALEFPRYSERLVVFCRGSASAFVATGMSVAEARTRRGWHVLAIDAQAFPSDDAVMGENAVVTIAAKIADAPTAHAPSGGTDGFARAAAPRPHPVQTMRGIRFDPIFATLFSVAAAMVLAATWFFHAVAGQTWIEAVYHVANTVTTTGADSGGLRPTDATRVVEIVLMLGSVSIIATLIAYVTAALTRHSIELSQGRHRVAGSGHVIVCGFGNVGSRVARYLLHLGERVAVIDRQPDATATAEIRARGAHVMTADASRDGTLELAGVRGAAAVLALTDSDSANIEIALTVAALAPDTPVIMRVTEPVVAQAAERHLRIHASYSAAALAAPLVAGLALEPGSRGTVDVCGAQCAMLQRDAREGPASPHEIVLAADEDVVLVMRRSA